MKFPVELNLTNHKHGGKIIRITGIGHGIDKPRDGYSRDYWHFFGDVEWRDGTQSKGLEIAPHAVCYEEDRSEIDALMAALSEYLSEHGSWHDHKSKHEGWYAHDRKIRRRA